jgi:hypothetical protein
MGTPLLRIKDENGVWHDVEAIRGLSAYQLAVKNGYEGTEEEWVAGIRGVAGKSAYEVAKDGGFTGTQAEWLASLKGAKGDNGAAGPTMAKVTATLTSNGWETTASGTSLNAICKFHQVVEVTGVTANSNGIVSISENMMQITKQDMITRARLFVLTQGNGTITIAGIGTKPTEDIPLVILITPEEESGT